MSLRERTTAARIQPDALADCLSKLIRDSNDRGTKPVDFREVSKELQQYLTLRRGQLWVGIEVAVALLVETADLLEWAGRVLVRRVDPLAALRRSFSPGWARGL